MIRRLPPDVERALAQATLQAGARVSTRGGGAVKPEKGALTTTTNLHPQQADTASILVEGNAHDVAMLLEMAKRLGLHVEPVKVPSPHRGGGA